MWTTVLTAAYKSKIIAFKSFSLLSRCVYQFWDSKRSIMTHYFGLTVQSLRIFELDAEISRLFQAFSCSPSACCHYQPTLHLRLHQLVIQIPHWNHSQPWDAPAEFFPLQFLQREAPATQSHFNLPVSSQPGPVQKFTVSFGWTVSLLG